MLISFIQLRPKPPSSEGGLGCGAFGQLSNVDKHKDLFVLLPVVCYNGRSNFE